MKKTVRILLSFTALYAFALTWTSCAEEDESWVGWWKDNAAFYDSISINPNWEAISTPQGPVGVYRNKNSYKRGEGMVYPLQTAQVTVDYIGLRYDGTVFDQGTEVPFAVNSVVSGFSVALQNMMVGDSCEVCMPYYLGYGASSTDSIPAYSTLIFAIKLREIRQYP